MHFLVTRLGTMQKLLVLTTLIAAVCGVEDDPKKLLDRCLDGKNHKYEPGPEDVMHGQCLPWKDHACCTGNTTLQLHTTDMYGFTYDHCRGQNMSTECRRHFTQDLCFYECSPNIGPWLQKVNMKIRKERFYQVPLCASDCDSWFDACRNDYTCTDNWTRNFKWVNGANYCPTDAPCRTFQEVYGDAKTFCERIWDDSWLYTPDDQHCMRIWFDPRNGNPNAKVAQWKVEQMLHSDAAKPSHWPWLLAFGCALTLLKF